MRDVLPKILDDKKDQSGETVEMNLFYGDVYASTPNLFTFPSGDRLLIQEISEHVKRIFEEKGLKGGVQHFTSVLKVNKQVRVMPNENIALSSFIRQDEGAHSMDMKFQLHTTAVKVLKSFGLDADLVNSFDDTMVFLKIDENNRYRGSVLCVICQNNNVRKEINLHCKYGAQNRVYWVDANLKRHLNSHFDPKSIKREKKNSLDDVNSATNPMDLDEEIEFEHENADEIELEDDDAHSRSLDLSIEPADLLENMVYEQISAQSLKMVESVLTYSEIEEQVSFKIAETEYHLQVASIEPDGSCLFRSLLHQLYGGQLSQTDEATKSLRRDVVAFIKKNFSHFEFELRGRVHEKDDEERSAKKSKRKKKSQTAQELQKKCKQLLQQNLSKSTYWGGSETIKAVSMMHSVNILIFCDDAPCYFANCGFNRNYTRTLLIAHKQAYKGNKDNNCLRNHYDSVSGIDGPETVAIAQYLTKPVQSTPEIIDVN